MILIGAPNIGERTRTWEIYYGSRLWRACLYRIRRWHPGRFVDDRYVDQVSVGGAGRGGRLNPVLITMGPYTNGSLRRCQTVALRRCRSRTKS